LRTQKEEKGIKRKELEKLRKRGTRQFQAVTSHGRIYTGEGVVRLDTRNAQIRCVGKEKSSSASTARTKRRGEGGAN